MATAATGKEKGLRSCTVCGEQAKKSQLARIVRTSDGQVDFDATGRAPGRGAYVCSVACFDGARKTKKLERALRCRLGEQDYERIAEALTAGGVRCTKQD